MVVASQLVAQVTAQGVEQTKSELNTVGQTSDSLGSKIKGAFGASFAMASQLAGQGLQFLGGQLMDSVKLAMDHQQVMAQTAQAIKSTGDASGETAQSISDMAESLSQVTPFSQDTIESGQNLLLTFTGIGKQVFPQATQAMLDMATAMHQGPQQGAIMLGKALNDPTTGLTALTRVGVTFSAQEKEQIKVMMAHNDVAGAQKVMLHELETEFGGSAKAAGQTFGGQVQIATNMLDDMKIKIGTALLPILSTLMSVVMTQIMPALDRFSSWFTANALPVLQKFSGFLTAAVIPMLEKFASNSNIVIPVLAALGAIIAAVLIPATLTWAAGMIAATWPVLAIGVAVAGLVAIFMHFYQTSEPFRNAINGIGHAFAPLGAIFQHIGSLLMSQLAPAWKQVQAAIQPLIPALQIIGAILGGVLAGAIGIVIGLITGLAKGIAMAIGGIVKIFAGFVLYISGVFNVIGGIVQFFCDLFTGHFNKLGGDLGKIWLGITQMFRGVMMVIQGIFQTAFGFLTGLVSGFIDGIKAFFVGLYDDLVGHSIIPDMVNGIISWIGQLPSRAMAFISQLVGNITGALGHLGSMALGWAQDMISGFVSGITNGIGAIGNAVGNIGNTIKSFLHFSKPDVGPLADVDTWMPDFTDKLVGGLNDGVPKLKSAMGAFTKPIAMSFTGSGGALSSGSIVPQSVSGASSQQPIVVQSPIYVDGRLVSRSLLPHMVDGIRLNASGVNGR